MFCAEAVANNATSGPLLPQKLTASGCEKCVAVELDPSDQVPTETPATFGEKPPWRNRHTLGVRDELLGGVFRANLLSFSARYVRFDDNLRSQIAC
jgi:hypothetical protein